MDIARTRNLMLRANVMKCDKQVGFRKCFVADPLYGQRLRARHFRHNDEMRSKKALRMY